MKIDTFVDPGAPWNGRFEITYFGRKLRFFGAGFQSVAAVEIMLDQPTFRIKVAEEQTGRADVTLKVKDFTAPTPEDILFAAAEAIKAAMRGQPVFAGCMMGIGRTGTFYAALMKVFYPVMEKSPAGGSDVRNMVRRFYLSHAVETRAQEDMLRHLDVSSIRRKLPLWAIKAWLGRL